ncbi:MAG: hypothetical protein LBH43_08545 [Treponema sp.]|nr:hypothetical protein [Treponema sp.]
MKSKFLIVLCVLLAVLAIGCTTTAAKVAYANQGEFGDVGRFPLKDFTSVGLVFTEVTLVSNTQGKNSSIEGEGFVYQKLLKEAQKLNADTIINVTIDKKTEVVGSRTTIFNIFVITESTTTTSTYYGSALAIKYAGTLKTESSTATTNDGNMTTTTTSVGGPILGDYPTNSAAGATGDKGLFQKLFKK